MHGTRDLPFALELEALTEPHGLRKRPRQERSRFLTRAVLEASLRVLDETGIEGLTTVRVAEVAGISIGSLYQYFPSKRALVAVVLAHYLAEIADEVVDACASTADEGLTDAMAQIIQRFVEKKRRLFSVSQHLRPVLAQQTSKVLVRAATQRVVGALAELLARFVEADGVSIQEAAQALAGAVEGSTRAFLEAEAVGAAQPETTEKWVMEVGLGLVSRFNKPR